MSLCSAEERNYSCILCICSRNTKPCDHLKSLSVGPQRSETCVPCMLLSSERVSERAIGGANIERELVCVCESM